MGFYLRKSISVGPFRFHLSKSGIGISAGIKGLRFGSGPRGNYVHMGTGGIYYRQTLPSKGSGARPRAAPARRQPPSPPQVSHPPSAVMTEIDSADVSQMSPSSSVELLEELNTKKQLRCVGPLASILGLILGGWLLTTGWHPVLLALAFVFAGAGVFLAWWRDSVQKTVVLFYDFDPDLEKACELLHDHALNLASCKGVWHISATGKVDDSKFHSGASEHIAKKSTTILKAAPPFVKTNIETIALSVGRQTLYLFPDRLLIDDGVKFGAVGYDEIKAHVESEHFVEYGSIPADAQIVGHTWKYVKKSGEPDLRFANNPQLPICLYEKLHLQSATGLNEMLQFSRAGTTQGFVDAMVYLAGFTPVLKS